MNNNTIQSKNSVLSIATILSALMLTAVVMPSLGPTTAFAQKEDVPDSSSLLKQLNADSTDQQETTSNAAPIVQTNVQPQLNVNVDVDLVFHPEDCQDASDDLNQGNEASSNQESSSDGPKVDTSVQTGLNVAVTPDLVFTDACKPTDHTTQSNDLSSNQQGSSNPEDGDHNLTDGSTYATSASDARNVAVDPNYSIDLPL